MKEHDIRPKALFERYLELAAADAARLLEKSAGFAEVPCPACGAARPAPGLRKAGFAYVVCGDCGSLYLSPRPTPGQLADFYRDAESVRFWATHFYKETEAARRERMFRPRAQAAAEIADALGLPRDAVLCDVGAGYGVFLEEAAKTGRFGKVLGVEPTAELAQVCRSKGFEVVAKKAEDLRPGDVQADLAACFEVLEHVASPVEFLSSCRAALKPGGRLLATTLVATGFDIAVLWERSKSVYPPHHINLMSVDGIARLFERAGYAVETLETPGRLDVDIVHNALADDPSLPLPPFIRRLVESDAETRAEFQAFLARRRLSSHVRVVASAR